MFFKIINRILKKRDKGVLLSIDNKIEELNKTNIEKDFEELKEMRSSISKRILNTKLDIKYINIGETLEKLDKIEDKINKLQEKDEYYNGFESIVDEIKNKKIMSQSFSEISSRLKKASNEDKKRVLKLS